ncbi:hypothetical protein Gotri_016572, partial [Gossypium trilobum]|nr:hypothetical protein [Gossypium trilobum]
GSDWDPCSSHCVGNICCGHVCCVRDHGTGYCSFSCNGYRSRLCFAGFRCLLMLFHVGLFNCSLAKGDLNRATRFTLVGKIHANKTLNRRGLKGFLQSIWSRAEQKEVRELGNNMYTLSLANLE